jgi:ribosomal protein S27AE
MPKQGRREEAEEVYDRCPNCGQIMQYSSHDGRYRCENCSVASPRNTRRRDGGVARPIEHAVRTALHPGDELTTPSGQGLTIVGHKPGGLVLLVGKEEAGILLSWQTLEQIPDFLRGYGWVGISGGMQECLDEYLNTFRKHAAAEWIAAVLERAQVVVINYVEPARVRLLPGW